MRRPLACPAPPLRAFTLVELLVVIGVISVLLLLLFPVYSSIRSSQKVKRTEAAVGALTSAAAAYESDYGLYPPAAFAPAGPNRGNRSLVALLDARGKPGWPYVPTAFLDDDGNIEGGLLLDEWGRPFIYFDTSAMTEKTVHPYDIAGDPMVRPAQGPDGFYNFSLCQLWSCGPNGRNDGGRNLHTEQADDLANFKVED
ncbi:MAG: type II secretion system protein [Candidatus Brocadiia bacterium]